MSVETKELATAPTKYNGLAPIGSANTLKALLNAQRESLMEILPKHVTPERLLKTMLVAVNRNQELLECTTASILETISRAAELGLDLSGTLGEAYPVPFNNKTKSGGWVKQCQLIIGYRGMAKLARQSGEIKTITADVVHANDHFKLRKGSKAECVFEPNYTDRGVVIGAFAHVEFKDGGEQFEFMLRDDIETIRRRSKAGTDRDGNPVGAWRSDWGEMAKKTVFKRLAKWLPLSPEKAEKFARAMEIDAEDYAPEILELETTPSPKKAALLNAIAKPSPGAEPPPDPEVEPDHQQPAPPDEPQQAPDESQDPEDAIVEAMRPGGLEAFKAIRNMLEREPMKIVNRQAAEAIVRGHAKSLGLDLDPKVGTAAVIDQMNLDQRVNFCRLIKGGLVSPATGAAK
jgi:recombination protein RecT